MRSAQFALALLTTLPACNKDQVAPDQPGGPGGEAAATTRRRCTMRGCVDGLHAVINKATPWQPGAYTFAFDLDGTEVECTGALPLKPCEAGRSLTCSILGPTVQIGESGCALPPDTHGFGDIRFPGAPKQVRVTISHDGKLLHSAELTPEYTTWEPNGEGCGTCSSARSELVIP